MSALMPTIVPITEAKAKLAFLVTLSETEDVVLTRHGRAAAVLVSVERYTQMLDQVEDLEDSLSAYETAGEPVVSEGQAYAELGLTSMMTDEELADWVETANNGEGPTPIASYTGTALREIMEAVGARTAAEERMRRAVNHAREEGATEAMIRLALGMADVGPVR